MEKRTFIKFCPTNISFILMSIGPPGIRTFDLVGLNDTNRIITKEGASKNILTSLQFGQGCIAKLSDDTDSNTRAHIKKQKQRIGYTMNDPHKIIRKNEFN
jgi:hypothetical protein